MNPIENIEPPYFKIGSIVTFIGLVITALLMGWNIYEAHQNKKELFVDSLFTGAATYLTGFGIMFLIIGRDICERFALDENAKLKIKEYIILALYVVGSYFAHDAYHRYLESLGYKETFIFEHYEKE